MKRKFEMGRQPANTKIGEKKITRIRVRGGNFKFRALRLDNGNFSWASEAVTRKTRILRVVYNSTNNELVRTNTLVKSSVIQIDSTPFKAWYLQYYNVDLSKKEAKEGQEAKKAEKEPKKGEKKEEKTQGKKGGDQGKKGGDQGKKGGDQGKKGGDQGKKEVKKGADQGKKEVKKGDQGKKEVKKGGDQGKKSGQKSKGKTITQKKPKELSKSQLNKFSRRSSFRSLEPALIDQFKTGRVYAKITSRPGQSGHCDGYLLEGDELAFYLKKMNLKKKK